MWLKIRVISEEGDRFVFAEQRITFEAKHLSIVAKFCCF